MLLSLSSPASPACLALLKRRRKRSPSRSTGRANTNHIGLFVARDKGFYAEAGLDVEILPYTDTSAGTLVANRVADFGISGRSSLFTQRAAGADLKAVYAVVQTETGRLVFNADAQRHQEPEKTSTARPMAASAAPGRTR